MPASAVLVTGASTGIGRACALRLDSLGFSVYAGVRREEDGLALKQQAGPDLHPLLLDITDIRAIDTAAEMLRADKRVGRLAGIVNNAGIAVAGPVEFIPLDDWRRQFEVNVFGMVAVIQRFLPMLRESRGRIVNMSSIGGLVGQPFVAPYVASKHAVEAISDALRIELRPWGIQVALVEPGAVATPIWEKGVRDTTARLAAAAGVMDLYGRVIARMGDISRQQEQRGVDPMRVAGAVAHALTSPRPRTRYLVGPEARITLALKRALPDRWFDELVMRFVGLPRGG
jgi:NAD(P)-dependent dehydrogenase (short-subunit alcohol dehydrogenase family)